MKFRLHILLFFFACFVAASKGIALELNFCESQFRPSLVPSGYSVNQRYFPPATLAKIISSAIFIKTFKAPLMKGHPIRQHFYDTAKSNGLPDYGVADSEAINIDLEGELIFVVTPERRLRIFDSSGLELMNRYEGSYQSDRARFLEELPQEFDVEDILQLKINKNDMATYIIKFKGHPYYYSFRHILQPEHGLISGAVIYNKDSPEVEKYFVAGQGEDQYGNPHSILYRLSFNHVPHEHDRRLFWYTTRVNLIEDNRVRGNENQTFKYDGLFLEEPQEDYALSFPALSTGYRDARDTPQVGPIVDGFWDPIKVEEIEDEVVLHFSFGGYHDSGRIHVIYNKKTRRIRSQSAINNSLNYEDPGSSRPARTFLLE